MLGNTNSNGLNPAKSNRIGGVYVGETQDGITYIWNTDPSQTNEEIIINPDESETVEYNTMNYSIEDNLDGSETYIIGGNQ